MLSAAILSRNIDLCAKLLSKHAFSEEILQNAFITACESNNVHCLFLLSGLISTKWIDLINQVDIANILIKSSKSDFCKFLAQRGLDIGRNDENNLTLISKVKQSVSRSVFKDLKRSEIFYQKVKKIFLKSVLKFISRSFLYVSKKILF